MGHRARNTNFDKRQLVIFHREKDFTYREIANLLCMKKSTVADVVKRYRKKNRIDFKLSKERPLNEREERWKRERLLEKLKRNPEISAPQLTLHLFERIHKNVHTNVRRVLNNHRYNLYSNLYSQTKVSLISSEVMGEKWCSVKKKKKLAVTTKTFESNC